MGGAYNLVNLALYHYAGNNPVRYTDPDGKKLSVEGSDNFLVCIFNMIFKTLYRIEVEKALKKIDPTAKMNYWNGQVTHGTTPKTGHENGYILLEGVIASSDTINITQVSGGNFFDPTLKEIGWNPISNPLIPTMTSTGTSVASSRPTFIGLAHELIHSLHYTTGNFDITVSSYIGLDGTSQKAKKEEQATVGVGFSYTTSYPTENLIRAEAGLNARAYY